MNYLLEKIKQMFIIMKLASIILLLGTLQLRAEVYAQEVTLEATNITLSEAMRHVSKQTGYNFVFNGKSLAHKVVTVSIKDASLTNAMNSITKPHQLDWSLKDGTIIVKQSRTEAVVSVAPVQQRQVTGTVTDQSGNPLPSVSVKEKGTSAQVSTGVDGTFSLLVHSESPVLEFSLLGYKAVQQSYRGIPMQISMTQQEVNIDEVVITGYQTIRKKNFTGASTTLKADDIRRDGVSDVSRMLEGQAAGVSVQNVSGTFGAAPKIRVRGATSITGENKPLWVVDGIVLEDVVNISNEQLSTGDPSTLLGSAVAGLNPDDIETFEILKDAAATSLYGARAMNGVVVITTKKGKAGRFLTSYTANFTNSLKPSYSSYDILDSYNQMKIFNELYMKGWLNYTEILQQSRYGVFGTMAKEIGTYSDGGFSLENSPEAISNYLDKYSRINTDWFDILFNNSLRQEHALSLSGGGEKTQTYASTSVLQDEGWAKGNRARRLTANLRTTFTPNEKLSFGFLATAYVRDQNAPGTLSRELNKETGGFSRDFDINPFNYALQTSRTTPVRNDDGSLFYIRNDYAPFNILEELDNNYLHIKSTDFKLQGELKYKILPALTYNLDAAYRFVKSSQDHIIRENSNMPRAYRAGTAYDVESENSTIALKNRFLYRDPNNVEVFPISILPYGGFRNRDAIDMDNYTFRNSLNYSEKFDDVHRVDLFAFQELRYVERSGSKYQGVGYQYDRGGVPNIDPNYFYYLVAKGQPYYDVQPTRERFLAFAGTGTYSYNDRYVVGGTVRYDGTNAMGQSSIGRWLPTWNVSTAWNMDEEEWFEKQNVLSTFKLRASYGLVASIGIAKNSGLVLRNALSPRPYIVENEPIMNIERLANTELTWEKMYKFNVGTDMSFVRGRYTVTLDWYDHRSFDLIGDLRTSGIGGETVKTANYANLSAKGVDIALSAAIVRNEKWKYRTALNVGYNKSKINDLRGNPVISSLVGADGGALIGYPQRGLFSLSYQGIDPINGSPLHLNQDGDISGNVYMSSPFVDNLIYHGPIDPIWTGGFNNIVSYKNITLNMLLTGSLGNKIRLNPAFFDHYSDLNALSQDFVNRWVLNTDNEVPAIVGMRENNLLSGTYPNSAYNFSDERVADGAFVRLKQVRLTYELPSRFLQSMKIKTASISLVGNNIALLYSDSRLNGQDPEFFASGGVALPLSKDYTFSLKLGF
jgi:TonB-linked SusC/RagA family outer membrane protein